MSTARSPGALLCARAWPRLALVLVLAWAGGCDGDADGEAPLAGSSIVAEVDGPYPEAATSDPAHAATPELDQGTRPEPSACAAFRREFERQNTRLWEGLVTVFVPGFAQYRQGKIGLGMAFSAAAIAGVVGATTVGTGTLVALPLGLLPLFSGLLSTYQAQVDNQIVNHHRLDPERSSMRSLLLSPFHFEHLSDPEVLLQLPIAFGAAGLVRLARIPQANPGEKLATALKAFLSANGTVTLAQVIPALLMLGSVAYMAGVGEEAFFRGFLLQKLNETYADLNLPAPAFARCLPEDVSRLRERYLALSPEERAAFDETARGWNNAAQALLFSLAHGGVAPSQLASGMWLGHLQNEEGDLTRNTFTHVWFDFLLVSLMLVQAVF